MSSLPSEPANLNMSEKLQKILVEGTKDVKFIFELNDENNTDNGPPVPKIARYDADSNSNEAANVVQISAHKQMLAASSHVFNAMFNGALKESGSVKITDASPHAFREFLQIFYSDQVELTVKNLGDVMKLIDKYGVLAGWPFVDRCFKLDLLNADILWGLHLAVKFQRDNLIAFCRSKVTENIRTVCEMIQIDDSCQPKFRSNPNNRPMTDADLANIFPMIWQSFSQMAGIVKFKLQQSFGMINGIDLIEDLSFKSYSKLLLTHLKYPTIYTYNHKGHFKGRSYTVEVIIGESKTYHTVPWNGGIIKFSISIRIQPQQKYTIQTKIILDFSSKPFFDVYKTPKGTIRFGSNIQIQCDWTQYSCVAAMNFVRCDE